MINQQQIKNFSHQGVLFNEIIQNIDLNSDKVLIETNFGAGSYSKKLLSMMTKNSLLLALDLDQQTKVYADQINDPRFYFFLDNFVNFHRYLHELNVKYVNYIIVDLGLSKMQILNESRGFSYDHDGKLDMRYDTNQKLTAYDVLTNASYSELVKIFYSNAEETYSKAIARKICQRRQSHLISTTTELKDLIFSVVNKGSKLQYKSVRRVFQALRMHVNNELDNLNKLLESAVNVLAKNGKILVISFNSIEDRVVKVFFKKIVEPSDSYFLDYTKTSYQNDFQLINKKPIMATKNELQANS